MDDSKERKERPASRSSGQACVCKSWRLILKNTIPRELPWLMMHPNDKDEDPDSRTFFSPSKQKIHTIPLPEMRGNRRCLFRTGGK
ncbi:hypothetical protein MRB53_022924 [Persea americana]|uniref:Uncharacterized protein n=1 Tax=Persea americana TaxID=3435 RepID=A0ACC2L8R5_PERAE|nr:hypothetical protein MRB53_022924 [Persea americana]